MSRTIKWRRAFGAVCLCAAVVLLSGRAPAQYVVTSGPSPTETETLAAKELADHLGRITGTAFKVVEEKEAASAPQKIYVGWTEFAASQQIDPAKLGEEEWVVRTIGPDLVITGGRPRGTLYGVYEFLERELGCRWLDENTDVVPKAAQLKFGPVNLQGQPAFWMREIYTMFSGPDSNLPVGKRPHRLRNKVNGSAYGSPGGCHTFAAYAKNFPADRPEYLSMNAQGKRIGATDGSGPGGICLTHPEVRKLVLARLREFVAADRAKAVAGNYPPPRVYDISQNDNHWMCQCPDCKAMSEREGSESGPLIDFINAVADGIRTEYPDIYVQTFAYAVTEKAPKTLRPRDNVIIRIAELNAEWGRESDLFHPATHPTNRAQFERLQAWSRIAKNIAEWDYWIQYSPNDKFPTPYAPLSCIAADLATFYRHGARTLFIECEDPEKTSFFALKRWLGYKLMQDPMQPAEPLIQAFMDGYYGPAAAKMREYLRFMEDRIAAVNENMSGMKNYARPYLTLDFYLACERLLDEAEALCAAAPQALLHVRRERIPVDAGFFHMWPDLTRNLPADRPLPFDRESLLKRYEQCRLEQLAALRTPQAIEKGRKDAAEEVEKMRGFILIEEKKKQPPARVRAPKAPDDSAQGDPTKADWTRAAELAAWSTTEGYPTQEKLSGRLLRDSRYLYIKLEHACDGAKLVSTPEMWYGDDWEMFFAARRGRPPYRQFAVNPRGESLGYEWADLIKKCQPKDWASGARVVSTPEKDRWTVLVSIPLENLAPGGLKDGRLYANFCRTIPSPRTHLSWSPSFESSFHVLSRLAEVRLE